MAKKSFMSAIPNESAAETARLKATAITQKVDQSAAETARLQRSGTPYPDQSAAETKRLGLFQHATNNVVPNSDQDPSINLKFQPNILDNYDAITYHWKFFMVDPESASRGDVMNVANQTVIAETGVTDLTIDKVEIQSIGTPSIVTGTGVETHLTFEITEPSGAAMIDKIFYQSIALGIGNWSVAPFYLQLSFRSRDPNTSASIDNPVGSIDDLNWVYPLKLGDIKANVTTVGTRYECSAIIYNDLAQQNVYFELQQTTVLNNVHTFGDAMRELEQKLNADELLKLIGTYSIPDTYKIVVDPVLASYKITPADQNINSSRNNNFAIFQGKDATFPAGTSVDKVIDTCLAQTKEAQTGLIQADVAGQDGNPINQETNQMKKFWRIYTETRPLKFDVRRADNSHEFTIFVYQYEKGVLDQNSAQVANGPQTKESIRRRLATYLKRNILRKKYNYIFTGLNDQIIKFDLDLNCAFAIARARLAGAYSNSAMADKGVAYQDNATQEAEVQSKLAKAISFLNSSATEKTLSSGRAQIEAVDSIKASALPESTKQRYLTLLENAKPENRLTYLNAARQVGTDINGKLTTAQFNAKSLARPISDKVPGFISDVDIRSPETVAMYKQFLEYNRGKLRPTVFVESMQDKSVGMGIESNSNSGVQKLSTMFSVALHGGLGGSLQQISMTIKGDPFWLFPYPISGTNKQIYLSLQPESDALSWIKTHHLSAGSANLIGTDNFFLLRFRTPRYYNLDTNPDEDSLTDSDTFSGVYQLLTITNRFHNGKFEQDIVAKIDPEIRFSDFSKEFEDDARTYDNPTTPADFLKGAVIPTTAVKKDIIMGSVLNKIPGVDQLNSTVTASADGIINVVNSKNLGGGAIITSSNIPDPIQSLPGLPPRFNT